MVVSVGILCVTLIGKESEGAELGRTGSGEINSSSSKSLVGTRFLVLGLLVLPKVRRPPDGLSVVVDVLALCLAAALVDGRLLVEEVPGLLL
jgi:hypothetical protein